MPELIFGEKSIYGARPPEQPESVILRLRTLWESRIFLGRAALAGLLFGTLLAFVIPTKYQSTTQLMPPDSQSTTGMAMLSALTAKGGGFGAMAGDLLGVQGSGDLFIGILRSQTLEGRLVAKFDLQRVYGTSMEVDAVKKLEENTSINQDRKSGIISITVTDHDPKRATAIAHAYVDELDLLVAELSTSAARRERMFLEQRLQSVKADLDQASRDFSQFASKNGAIDIKEQSRAMLDAAATLMGELIAAESEAKGLEAIYSDNNVHVRAVRAKIAELRSQLEKMGGDKGLSIDGPARAGEASYPSIRELPLLGVSYADLYRRTKIQETVYETLTQQYELAKVQEAKETPSVKVLDAAKIPQRKSFPPRLEIMFLCLILALMGAAIWILAHSRWGEIDNRNPGKILAEEVLQSVRTTARTARQGTWNMLSRNGHSQAAQPSSGNADSESPAQLPSEP